MSLVETTDFMSIKDLFDLVAFEMNWAPRALKEFEQRLNKEMILTVGDLKRFS